MSPVGPGTELWKSLDPDADLAALGSQAFAEFPQAAAIWDSLNEPMERRRFLRLLAASAALAAFPGCLRLPMERIVPSAREPADGTAVKTRDYASAFLNRGLAEGILARSFEGRPTKLEGNPDHPVTRGGSTIHLQAELLGVYDPERARIVRRKKMPSTWDAFYRALESERARWRASGGRGLRILSEPTTSPTLVRQMRALAKRHPQARWVQAEGFPYRSIERAFLRARTGRSVLSEPNFAAADVIVAFERDFLSPHEGVRLAREYADRRRAVGRDASPVRLYVAESAPSLAGAAADYRLPAAPAELRRILRELHAALEGKPAAGPLAKEPWLAAVARDVGRARGRVIFLVGESLGEEGMRIAEDLNFRFGRPGQTIAHRRDPFADALEVAPLGLAEFGRELERGEVDGLIVLGGNPAHAFGARFDWAKAFGRVRFSAVLAPYENETSELAEWVLPEAHSLEAWGDARAADGTVTLLQPLVAPFYEGKSALEVVAALDGAPGARGRDLLAATWKDLDSHLAEGFVPNSGYAPVSVAKPGAIAGGSAALRTVPLGSSESPHSPDSLEVVVRPGYAVGDGRWAPNAWLQELPDPITKEVWGNAAWISPDTAKKRGLATGDVVTVSRGGRNLEIPLIVVPGMAAETLLLEAGYGRRVGAGVGAGIGVAIEPLLTDDESTFRAEIGRTGRRAPPVTTQMHQTMAGREPVRVVSEAHRVRGSESASKSDPSSGEKREGPPSLLPKRPALRSESLAWGMVIDLSACIGCQACTIACQAENNIPVVGREEVRRGREMHWIRVDRYFRGSAEAPEVLFQPVPCMHCEHAPCEEVCPTAATVHSPDGLNQMIYNRCVGTRYCSNNCPYKVRRFNFFGYADTRTELARLAKNPEVTVRTRGVMEKCTYCVQRIERARIAARIEHRPIRDGDVRTACQSACPTRAIMFGNLADPSAEVVRWKSSPLDYALLEELGTRPRTTYLARIANREEGAS